MPPIPSRRPGANIVPAPIQLIGAKPPPPPLSLTTSEQLALELLDTKLKHIRDAVGGVAKSYSTGLFLHGEGGTGKSFAVGEELENLEVKYEYHNSRMTGRGLFDALMQSPSDLHWIEDAETMMDDKLAWGVLRSALWSQNKDRPMKRLVTWSASKTNPKFIFTGGIIVISNADLVEADPELRAIKTRIQSLKFDINSQEILALMKRMCLPGYRFGEQSLSPAECWEVAKFIKNHLESLNRKMDLRLLTHGFRDRLQWEAGDSELNWRALLKGRMQERVIAQEDEE